MLERLKNDTLLLRPVDSYLRRHYWQAAAMYQAFSLSEEGGLEQIKEGFEVYVCAEGIDMNGLIISGPNNLVFVHFADERVKTRYSVLKTLLTLRPSCLIGNPYSVTLSLEILRKSLVQESVQRFNWMAFDANAVIPVERERLIKDIRVLSGQGVEMITANEVPFQPLIPFLIEVEKSFDRNPLSINQLKKKLDERVAQEAYLLFVKGDQVIGQGLLEYNLPQHKLLGGIYLSPKYRSSGLGGLMTRALMQIVIDQGKTPALTVEETNDAALHLYKKLGFSKVADLSHCYIKLVS